MKQVQARKHKVDHVLIETSGLALPTPVMRALAWPEIRTTFQLDAVITVVDTPHLLAGDLECGKPIPGADAAEVPEHLGTVDSILYQQLENADVVVLNKIDELPEESLMKAEELVRQKAPKIRFLELAYHAELDTRLCLGLKVHDEATAAVLHDHDRPHHGPVQQMPMEMEGPLENQSQFDGHTHTGIGSHVHGEHSHQHFHEHDTGWQAFVLHCDEAQDVEKIKNALRDVTLQQPILRAKGFAFIGGKDRRLVVQAVRTRVQTYFEQDESHETESSLVFIGYHPRREQVVGLMRELTGSEWR
jgi:cobalamin biosynthesis protein CobW